VVAGMTHLGTLALARSNLDGAGLERLKSLARLNELDLSDTQVRDDDLKQLLHFKDLRYLQLAGCRITGDGLDAMGRLPRLSRIDLSRTPLNGNALGQLRNLRLVVLNL